MTRVLLFADENGEPLRRGTTSDYLLCYECGKPVHLDYIRRGEDDNLYCAWCYDSTGQDPGALQGIDPEN